MVDHGASVTDTQLQIARDSALVILNAIDEHDKVSGRNKPHFSHLYWKSSSEIAFATFSFNDIVTAFPGLNPVGGRDGSLLFPGPVL